MSGFIFVVEHPERIDRIQEFIDADPFAGFSDVINSFDWTQTKPDLCLISFDGENITHVGLVRCGNKVANYIFRLVFRPIFAIQPIPFAKLQ